MPNLLMAHPNTHKRLDKTYFIPCTIKLQPEYQHLATQFSPIITNTHPTHQEANIKYPHLAQYISHKQNHPPTHILYALITTISPSLETCNNKLIHPPDPNWTSILLLKMSTLQNPPERYIATPHPYIQFINRHQNIIKPPNTIHKEIYNFIVQQNEPITLQTMSNQFPYLPIELRY